MLLKNACCITFFKITVSNNHHMKEADSSDNAISMEQYKFVDSILKEVIADRLLHCIYVHS